MHILDLIEPDIILEGKRATRQYKKIGNVFKKRFRCNSGPKAGTFVSKPKDCGIIKDPKRVRQGMFAARSKAGQRVRKAKFSKRMTLTKFIQRLNNMYRGGANEGSK